MLLAIFFFLLGGGFGFGSAMALDTLTEPIRSFLGLIVFNILNGILGGGGN